MAMESTTRRYGEGSSEWSERTEHSPEDAKRWADQAKEKAAQFGETAKMKATQFGEKAKDMADARKDQVGTRLEEAGHYMRSKDTTEMWHDVEEYVKRHPMQAIAGAVVAGILMGRILK